MGYGSGEKMGLCLRLLFRSFHLYCFIITVLGYDGVSAPASCIHARLHPTQHGILKHAACIINTACLIGQLCRRASVSFQSRP